jgi:YesN/AraC family two-component response regulator
LKELRRRIREMQRKIFENGRIAVTATESEKAEAVKRIAGCYARALGRSMYSLVSGRQAFIGSSDFTDNESCRILSFSTALARRLSDDIRTGNTDRIEETLGRIVKEIAELQYRNVMLSIMHLVNLISDTMDEINQSRLEPLMIDYDEFQRLLDSPSLSNLQDECVKTIRKFSNRASQLESEKHAILVDAIRKIIQSDYTDPNLGLKKIANMMKMSPCTSGGCSAAMPTCPWRTA